MGEREIQCRDETKSREEERGEERKMGVWWVRERRGGSTGRGDDGGVQTEGEERAWVKR